MSSSYEFPFLPDFQYLTINLIWQTWTIFFLTDMGSHVFDRIGFLFGEVDQSWCMAGAVNPKIKGEDMVVHF